MFTYKQLIATQTEAEAVSELKTILTGSGFTVIDDAKSGTVAFSLLMLASKLYTAGQEQAATLVLNSVERTAEADFLTAVSDSFFDNQRMLGIQTVGSVFLSYDAGQPSRTFAAGGLSVSFTAPNTTQYELTNVNQVSLVPGAQGAITVISASRVQILIRGSVTRLWDQTEYFYDVQGHLAVDGEPHTVVKGRIALSWEATRSP
jgi:hypothetical protein